MWSSDVSNLPISSDSKLHASLKPIFHRKLRSSWLPNTNEIDTNNMKCTCPLQTQPLHTQRELYSTARVGAHFGCAGVHVGCAGGRVGCAGVCAGSMRLFRYQHVGIRENPTLGVFNAKPQGEWFRVAVEYRVNYYR